MVKVFPLPALPLTPRRCLRYQRLRRQPQPPPQGQRPHLRVFPLRSPITRPASSPRATAPASRAPRASATAATPPPAPPPPVRPSPSSPTIRMPPSSARSSSYGIALAHNGNIINAEVLREELAANLRSISTLSVRSAPPPHPLGLRGRRQRLRRGARQENRPRMPPFSRSPRRPTRTSAASPSPPYGSPCPSIRSHKTSSTPSTPFTPASRVPTPSASPSRESVCSPLLPDPLGLVLFRDPYGIRYVPVAAPHA